MASKRERQPNWSISEITLLQELVEKDEFVIKSKQTNTLTNNKKNEKWAEICSKINAIGLQKRTTEQVKYKWGNLQQNAKKIYNDVKKQRKLTGGGPAPKPPSAVEEKIIEMMKDRSNFSGISCGFESTMPPVFESTII
ncbi:myb-related transcription factor, partner of profilin-like [Mytilus trossulus]|uniref:myb-related transcription factor, partner of profilin-like n=1 Tax=Mytilus trossulus TaxID=6551 RepID=UPI0030068C1C